MSCLPGTPCFENTVNAFYPQKCDNGWFKGYPIAATDVKYNGPNLPNSGVDTGDGLVVALEKLDAALDPYTIAQQTLYMIFQNTDLLNSFCTLTGLCVPTTTLPPTVYYFPVLIDNSLETICGGAPLYVYSLSETLVEGLYLYADNDLTIPLTGWSYVGSTTSGQTFSINPFTGQVETIQGTTC